MHLGDKVSGVSFTTKTSWQNYSCISYKCEISQIYIIKVKKSKIKLLISACILYGQLHKKNIKFAILSSEMLANDWVPILVVFLWMDLDSGFNSLTSNLLNVWKNSNVAFAVRIYCYFPLVPKCGHLLPFWYLHSSLSQLFFILQQLLILHSPVVAQYLKSDENELLLISSIIMAFIIILSESFRNMQLSPQWHRRLLSYSHRGG